MTQLSRRSLVKLGAAAACQISAAVSRAGTPTVTSTEDWMAESADAELLIPEPTFALADLWWTEQRNVWTPIGWKDHYFRFNVLYNGTIICEPCPHFAPPRPHALRWQGQSFQLNFTPLASEPPRLPAEVTQLWRTDGGVGIQGWNNDHSTPVLWTEWRLQDGLVIRQEIFSHIAGAKPVVTGIQSIQCSAYLAFYCARLSVIDEIVSGELHLLRLCPQAWITSEEESAFENMPTFHGTVNLRFRLSPDKRTLELHFAAKWHNGAPRVIVHTPPIRGLTHIAINGRHYTPSREIVL